MRLHSMDFPDQQWEAIQQESKRQGISAAYLIRRVMDVYLDRVVSHTSAPVSSTKLVAPVKIARRATKMATK